MYIHGMVVGFHGYKYKAVAEARLECKSEKGKDLYSLHYYIGDHNFYPRLNPTLPTAIFRRHWIHLYLLLSSTIIK